MKRGRYYGMGDGLLPCGSFGLGAVKAYYLPAGAPEDAEAHEFAAPSEELAAAAVQALADFTGQEYDLYLPGKEGGKQ